MGSDPPEIYAPRLAAAGYAVLFPALPRAPGEEPWARMTQDAEAALDEAAATGLVSRDRVAVWGQSFGGYAALRLAARSSRFKAVVAQSAPTDLFSLYGSFPAPARARPASLEVRDSMMGYLETGQGGLGAPPWRDPEAYIRNSPIFWAPRISAPVLLVTGEQDFFPASQSEEMFSALRRLDRDVLLISFPGEGHTLTSPAARRTYEGAVLSFLARVLGPP